MEMHSSSQRFTWDKKAVCQIFHFLARENSTKEKIDCLSDKILGKAANLFVPQS